LKQNTQLVQLNLSQYVQAY